MLRSLTRAHAKRLHEQAGDRFEPQLVFSVEARGNRAVEVEHADQRAAAHQRHHQFRTRGRIAGDVAGERVHVGDPLRLARARGRAAHALVERDAHAGGQALEGADHQFGAVEEIEADPVQLRQRVVDQRREVGGVGDAVALAVQQGARLFDELGVLLRLAAGQRGGGEHAPECTSGRRRYHGPVAATLRRDEGARHGAVAIAGRARLPPARAAGHARWRRSSTRRSRSR